MESNHPSQRQQIYSLPRYPYGITSHITESNMYSKHTQPCIYIILQHNDEFVKDLSNYFYNLTYPKYFIKIQVPYGSPKVWVQNFHFLLHM